MGLCGGRGGDPGCGRGGDLGEVRPRPADPAGGLTSEGPAAEVGPSGTQSAKLAKARGTAAFRGRCASFAPSRRRPVDGRIDLLTHPQPMQQNRSHPQGGNRGGTARRAMPAAPRCLASLCSGLHHPLKPMGVQTIKRSRGCDVILSQSGLNP